MTTKIKNILTLLLFGISATVLAQNPKWFKKARKTQLTIITYDAQGTIRQGQGFYVSENGAAIAEYDLLKGAARATAVDSEGKEYNITHILGASSLYNTVKLETNNQKAASMPIANAALSEQSTVYIMPICNTDKKAECIADNIAKVETFGEDKCPYYTLSKAIDERYAGCPVFSEEGELIGHIQLPAKGSDKPAFVLGASYGNSLKINAFDVNNNDLKAIDIAKALPEEESQASSYLFLMSRQNSQQYRQQVEDFVAKFPKSSTGYIQLAEHQAATGEYKEAEATYAKALEMKTGHDDEIHHSYAKLLYQAGLRDSVPSEGWTMEHALQEAEAAFTATPQPIYTALQGMCLYALKRYDDAYGKFLEMSQTNMRSAEYFLYASQCKQMLKAENEEILALQDSAVNCFTKPYPAEAANYLYLRSKTLAELGRNREAVTDLNEFEHLAAGNVSAQFYYEREQLEMQCRMFPAALNDIERAAKLQPDEPLFRAEEAVVNYRVGQIDAALTAAQEAVRLDDSFADAHRILGICLRDKGKTAEAKKSLQRAIDLGDAVAQSVLDKMK